MKVLCSLLFVLLISVARAGEPGDSSKALTETLKRIDSIESTLHYKTGRVVLGENLATIDIKKGFKFLDAKEAKYVLEDVWGNLKGQNP